MIKIENTEVVGWEAAIRGMRNPMNSWEKSDSQTCTNCKGCLPGQECERYKNGTFIGPNDLDLMTRLRNAGTDHRKFMRMITVYLDITAPLYWWKEFKTYRAGRKFGDDEPGIVDEGYLEYDIEMNSCSTMHKIASKEFTLEDFSHEHLLPTAKKNLESTIDILNGYRDQYGVDTNPEVRKRYWWQMIQLLPSSYNQRRTVMLNYEVLANIYKSRKDHKLDEWRLHEVPGEHAFRNKDFTSGAWGFCDWIESLPCSELITGKENN